MKNNIYTSIYKTFFKAMFVLLLAAPVMAYSQTDSLVPPSLLNDSMATNSIPNNEVMELTIDSFISKDALESRVTYKAKDSIRFDMKNQKMYQVCQFLL